MRFKPVVTRIKLNPEQAVLTCTCWGSGRAVLSGTGRTRATICAYGGSERLNPQYRTTQTNAAAS